MDYCYDGVHQWHGGVGINCYKFHQPALKWIIVAIMYTKQMRAQLSIGKVSRIRFWLSFA